MTSDVRVGEWRGQEWSREDVFGLPGLPGDTEGQQSIELSKEHKAITEMGMPGSSEF